MTAKKRFIPGNPRPNNQLRYISAMLSCPDCRNCGRRLAAVPMGTLGHNRRPHIQRPSSATKLSGYAGAYQLPQKWCYMQTYTNCTVCSSTVCTVRLTKMPYVAPRCQGLYQFYIKHAAWWLLWQPMTYVNFVQEAETLLHPGSSSDTICLWRSY